MRDSTDAATPTTAFPAAPSLAHRRRVLLVFLIALVPFAWLTVRFNWPCDDAFISFRYAKHLAEGHGLRYNVGEDPPVEGYTNFLWVLVLTPLEAMGWWMSMVTVFPTLATWRCSDAERRAAGTESVPI